MNSVSSNFDFCNEAFNSLSIMLARLDEKGLVVSVNRAFRKYLRKPESNILNQHFWRVLLNLSSKPQDCIIDAVEICKKRETREIKIKNKWLKVTADPILDSKKDLKNIIVSISDITEKKNNLKELEIRESKFKDLVVLANIAIASDDVNGNLVYFNNQFANLFGYTEEEIKTKSHRDLIHPDDYKKINDIHSKRFQSDEITPSYEFRGIKKDGSIVYIDISVNEIYRENGEVIGTRSYLRDITERKRFIGDLENALEEAKESNRLKSAFLTNISHEIRTPLNGIMGFSKLLNKDDLSDADKKTFTSIIEKSSNQLLEIVSNILDISKIETGQLNIINKRFHLNEFIDDISKNFKFVFFEKEIDFIVKKEFDNKKDEVFSDIGKLKQVITNLLSNALKFTNSGTVELAYILKNNFIQFSVVDSGIGIEKEFCSKIFENFRQVELTYSRNFEGTGLGLSISKGFIEKMGGEIWVESEISKGSKFYFTIPYIS